MRLLYQHWSYDPAVLVGVVAMVLELAGYRRLRGRRAAMSGRGMGFRRVQVWLFGLGVGIAVGAVTSPIDYWSDYYFWVHMLQHILLMLIAPFIITLAAPWATMYWGLPTRWRRRIGRGVFRSVPGRWLRAVGRFCIHPAISVGLFTAVMVGWLVPAAYDLAYENQTVHVYGMHLSMFVSGMLVFATALGTKYPAWPRASIRGQLAAIIVPALVMWGMAMALGLFATGSWYPVYAHLPGVTMSPFASQRLGGGELWVCGDLSLVPALVLVVKRFLDRGQEHGAAELLAAVLPSKPRPVATTGGTRPRSAAHLR